MDVVAVAERFELLDQAIGVEDVQCLDEPALDDRLAAVGQHLLQIAPGPEPIGVTGIDLQPRDDRDLPRARVRGHRDPPAVAVGGKADAAEGGDLLSAALERDGPGVQIGNPREGGLLAAGRSLCLIVFVSETVRCRAVFGCSG
ncbi:hypothetical protein [Nonomuraea wenchangensis]|uniref:hypothetical protein n=1 Tax=Nonomuraea wenchangensis TaxID=568860 RepID=UPI001C434C20|nr:hypothetical protein [Nonomuraea wenchangensis]